MMNENNLKIIPATLEEHNCMVSDFTIEHFANNPLNVLLPIPQKEMAEFWKTSLIKDNSFSLLAFRNGELVGYRTGQGCPGPGRFFAEIRTETSIWGTEPGPRLFAGTEAGTLTDFCEKYHLLLTGLIEFFFEKLQVFETALILILLT